MKLKTRTQAIMTIESFKAEPNLEELIDKFWHIKWIEKNGQFQWFDPQFIIHVKTMTDNPLLIAKWMRNALYEFSRIINRQFPESTMPFIEKIIRYEQSNNVKLKDLVKGYLGIGEYVDYAQELIRQSAKEDRKISNKNKIIKGYK